MERLCLCFGCRRHHPESDEEDKPGEPRYEPMGGG
jgi:hypothetical protein